MSTEESTQGSPPPNPRPADLDVEPTKPVTRPSPGEAAPDGATAMFDSLPGQPPTNSREQPDLPLFVAADYADFITGSGAEKLADSGVAPLVAAARGYKRLDSSNFAPEMRMMGVKLSTKQGKRLQQTLNGRGNDGMQMPWYSLADIQRAEKGAAPAAPFTYQIRPGKPELEHGKPVKYEFLAGVGTPLDTHPTVPAGWIDTTPIVMIAEGLLKGDSALTSYLHKMGAGWDELRDGSEGAPERLLELLKSTPVTERILILSIAGINNTVQNPVDWRHIKLRDREVWIAFDADLDSNIHVWRAAAKLWQELEVREKVDRVRLLSPKVAVSSGIEKAGIDDFLAKLGTWDDLLLHMTTGLPEAPVVNSEDVLGAWRISKDGTFTEECVAVNGPNGETIALEWRHRLPYAVRIVVLGKRRQPTSDEVRTGVFDKEVLVSDPVDSYTQLEVTWMSGDEKRVARVWGPDRILLDAPSDWHRWKPDFDQPLLLLPEWPPSREVAARLFPAIKRNRVEDIEYETTWDGMGWVPVPGGNPVFLIGDQIIGDTRGASVLGGIRNEILPVAEHYGIGEEVPEGEFGDEEYHVRVLADLKVVLDAYVHRKPFTERSTAAIVLGGALRPVLPLRPVNTIYFWGPKNAGKSFAAMRMMAFWAAQPSAWTDSLPGSAKDTLFYNEYAVSVTPIWVVDDLAPSNVQAQARSEEAKIADQVRNMFNNASKGRMQATGKPRQLNKPVAQLIITAENPLTVASAKERLIPAHIGPGKLNPDREPTDHLERIAVNDGTPARLTAHLIKFVLHTATKNDGWAAHVKLVQAHVSATNDVVQQMMRNRGANGSVKRAARLATDLVIVFDLLREMAVMVGADQETIRELSREGLISDLVDGVLAAHHDNQESSPGKSVLLALKALMAAGDAHVMNAALTSAPPMVGVADDDLINVALGWSRNTEAEGGWRKSTKRIGSVVMHPDHGPVILFDVREAFKVAQAAYPDLVPYGQSPTVAWEHVWTEALTPPGITRPKDSRTKKPLSTWKLQGVSGVPITVEAFLKLGEPNREEDEPEIASTP